MKSQQMKLALKELVLGVLAGILIVAGCCVYLACSVKWVGAILFSVALSAICYLGFNLYTGKIGGMVANHKKEDFAALLLGLLGNTVGVLVAFAVAYAVPSLGEAAKAAVSAKLLQSPMQTLLRAVGCGVLMYVAVAIFREKKSPIGILLCIPAFILSGFEHSIADMGYFALAGVATPQSLGYVWLAILGNTVGSLLVAFARRLAEFLGKSHTNPDSALDSTTKSTEENCVLQDSTEVTPTEDTAAPQDSEDK